MAQPSPSTWWNPFGSFLTDYSFLVDSISLICLGLGLMFFVPIFFLIILDFFLWVFRLVWNSSPTQTHDSTPPAVDRAPASAVATGISKPQPPIRC